MKSPYDRKIKPEEWVFIKEYPHNFSLWKNKKTGLEECFFLNEEPAPRKRND